VRCGDGLAGVDLVQLLLHQLYIALLGRLKELIWGGFFLWFFFLCHVRLLSFAYYAKAERAIALRRQSTVRAQASGSCAVKFFSIPSWGRAFCGPTVAEAFIACGAAPPLCGSLRHEDRRRGSRSLRENPIYYMTGSNTARLASSSQVSEKHGI
jgi:hypothetical protein